MESTSQWYPIIRQRSKKWILRRYIVDINLPLQQLLMLKLGLQYSGQSSLAAETVAARKVNIAREMIL